MATVAAEVRRRRKERGMSAQDLADACTDLGHPIPRNVIANMESGRRATLPLVDLIVLGAALNTSPLLLLYPLGRVYEVQRLPLISTESTWEALRWFTGEAPAEFGAKDPLLSAFRAHQHHATAAIEAERKADHSRWQARTAHTPAEREAAQRRADHHAEEAERHRRLLHAARDLIEEEGGTPPHLSPELHETGHETPEPEESP
jgi:transcriptional regulator with XRE-family HTH domain